MLCNDGFPPPPPKPFRPDSNRIIKYLTKKAPTAYSDTSGRIRSRQIYGCTCGSSSCWNNSHNRPHSFDVGLNRREPLIPKFRSVKKKPRQCHTYLRRPSEAPPAPPPASNLLLAPLPPIPPRPARVLYRSLGIQTRPLTRKMGGSNSHVADRITPSPPTLDQIVPASPLTGGRDSSPLGESPSMSGFTFRKRGSALHLIQSQNENQSKKVLYRGPGQVYQGPAENNNNKVRSEGPDPMIWPEGCSPYGSEDFKSKIKSGIISLSPSTKNTMETSKPPDHESLRQYYFPNDAPGRQSNSITNLVRPPPPPPMTGVTHNHKPKNPNPTPTPQQQSSQQPLLLVTTYPSGNGQANPPIQVNSSTAGSVNPSVIPSKILPYQIFTPVPVVVHQNQEQAQHQQQPPPQPQPQSQMNSLVPNEIQDDLLRIEMLLELRKYKRALSQQLQAQQRLVQMCGNGSNQNLSESMNVTPIGNNNSNSQVQVKNESESLRNLLVAAEQLRYHQNFSDTHTNKRLMDIFQILGDTATLEGDGSVKPPGENKTEQQQQQQMSTQPQNNVQSSSPSHPAPGHASEDPEKNTTTVWERELEKHLNSSEFINSFMEPHINKENSTAPQPQPQNPNPKTVDLLRGAMNTEDFETSDKSRSGFPSGLQLGVNMTAPTSHPQSLAQGFPPPNLQNPLLAGAAAVASASVPGHHPIQGQANLQGQSQNRSAQQVHTLQRQYQQYHALDDIQMFPERLQNLPPNILKLLEAKLSTGTPTTPAFPSFLNDPPPPPPQAKNSSNTSWQKVMHTHVGLDGQMSPSPLYSPVPSTTPGPQVDQKQAMPYRRTGNYAEQKLESHEHPVEEKISPYFPGYSEYVKEKRKSASASGIATPVEQIQKSNQVKTPSGSYMVDVGELENLLNQLPVVSRKQKAEEFAFKTLKSASPVPEAESETSMIPLVSSQGTVATGTSRAGSSSGRPDTTDVEGMITDDDDLKNVDTTKMSIKELVTLGRKIYRILSQLNTSPDRNQTDGDQSPVTIDLPALGFSQLPPQYAPFIEGITNKSGGSRKEKRKSASQTNAAKMVLADFNSGANPTFITGPGIVQTKSQPKVSTVTTNGTKRTTPVNTPKLFKKIVQPPPTRWTRGGQSINNTQPGNRNQSVSSLPSTRQTSRTGNNIKLGGEETNVVPAPRHQPPPNFPVINRLSNNRRGYTQRELGPQVNIRRRKVVEPQFYDVGDPQFQFSSTNTNTTGGGGGRSRSGGTAGNNIFKRNFIRENITKIKTMKKIPDVRVRPKPLPPIKKKYDSIPSTIQSRSPSRSLSAARDGQPTRRSSSMPVTPGRGSQNRLYGTAPGTGRSSRQSSMSIGTATATARSRSPSIGGSNHTGIGLRYTRTRVISRVPTEKLVPVGNNVGRTSSMKKFGQSGSYTVRPNASGQSVGGGSARIILRKSRSKTRRVSTAHSVISHRSSSTSSVDRSAARITTPPPHRQRSRQGNPRGQGDVKRTKAQRAAAAAAQKRKEEEKRLAEEKANDALYTSSDQVLIRNMVKEEMDEIMQRHVNTLIKQQENMGEKQRLQQQQQKHNNQHQHQPYHHIHHNHHRKGYNELGESDDSSTIIASENLTPIYTPPKIYDESLFSLEKWINPDSQSIPVTPTPLTSAKDTPATTATYDHGMSLGVGTGQGHGHGTNHSHNHQAGKRQTNKSQTVRFSLPIPHSTPTN